MHYEASTPELARILEAARGVNGKRRGDVVVKEFRGPINVNSYWDDGSKDEYCLVDLASLECWQVPTSHPYFDRKTNGERCGELELRELPPNVCLVQGGYFCGKSATYRLHFHPDNLAKLLPDSSAPTVSDKAKAALNVICGIKSSYRQDEFNRSGLGMYGANNPLVAELKAAGFVKVNKAGAISVTTAGRNARQ